MTLFQAVLLIGLGFCLGRMCKWLNKEWNNASAPKSINHIVRIHDQIISLLIISIAIILIFLLVELVGPYLT